MHAYLHCLSHTPLVGFVDPEQAVLDEVNGVIADALGGHRQNAGGAGEVADGGGADAEAERRHHVIEKTVVVAVSYNMQVDHGFAQPLEFLLGGLDRLPVLPVFINGVGRRPSPAPAQAAGATARQSRGSAPAY
jgi:2,3-dihydroxyphenylpropionate 1,2-dioxygenase